ncbi:alanine racemase [Peptococcaceae bacterium 1198_IL3148]
MMAHPIWAEVDLSAIAHNVGEVRRVVKPQAKVMAVVKANGYGHGAVPVAKTALANGADCLAVARLGEALVLRKSGITGSILLLGYTPPEQYQELIANDLTQTVYTLPMARELNSAALKMGKQLTIHIKIDTGMGRLGFIPDENSLAEIEQIKQLPQLNVEGIFTHFAKADAWDKAYVNLQFERFTTFIDKLSQRGIKFKLRHAANSAAIIDHPDTHLDMVRAGIMMYGLYPSSEVNRDRVILKPAMALKTRVAHIKRLPAGNHISYGCRYCTEMETTIATLPLGYADGFTRMLKKGEVLVAGQRAPVVGSICMDQCMVDLGSNQTVQTGDEVVVIGCQGDCCIPVEELAEKLGTINYELVCMVATRVPRIYK